MRAAAALGRVGTCSSGLLHRPSLFSLLTLFGHGAHVATTAAPQLRRLAAHFYFYNHNSNMSGISSAQCLGPFLMKWLSSHWALLHHQAKTWPSKWVSSKSGCIARLATSGHITGEADHCTVEGAWLLPSFIASLD